MAFQSFEDLEVWKRACPLAVVVYEHLDSSKEFGFRDQMQRAAVSVASNIAEGSERSTKDFCRFLTMARGSAAELRTQAYIAGKIGVLPLAHMQQIVEETRCLAKMLVALARSLKSKSERRKTKLNTEN